MKKKTKKFLTRIGLVLAIVGGLVHLFQPLGLNLLSLFFGVKGIVQFIAGAVTIIVSIVGWKMSK